MDRPNSILRYLKRKHESVEEHNVASQEHNVASEAHNVASQEHNLASEAHNVASGSGVGCREGSFDLSNEEENEEQMGGHGSSGDYMSSRDMSFDLSHLPMDPGERKLILEYPLNVQDEVRRYYVVNGPVQPRSHSFPLRMIGGKKRRFNPSWFDKHGVWLEYSVKKDAAFCLFCYLFGNLRDNRCGDFVEGGFNAWNKAVERFNVHVGDFNSVHNQALRDFDNFRKPKQSIVVAFDRHSEEMKKQYRLRLDTSVLCSRYLLRQGLPFRGHDESESSKNRGNFLELVKFAANLNDVVANVVLDNAPKNNKLVAPDIQKDIVNAAAKETIKAIIERFRDDVFGLLIDESGDIAHKEQMGVVFRYVDKMGIVKERFIGVIHVTDTSSLSLKAGLQSILSEHSLSLSRVRSQGYDGASNMQGKFNGLKTLILNENECAYSIHCFSHQLQLTLVALARDNNYVENLFDEVAKLLNVVGASCKRHDLLREAQAQRVKQALSEGEIETGRGLNQELALARAGDTRWGSHYKSLMNVAIMYDAIMDVLEYIEIEGESAHIRNDAISRIAYLSSFDFAFTLQLMMSILGHTHHLSQALQKKDQNIANAMDLVNTTKQLLQTMREDGWDYLMEKTCAFCQKHNISIPNMNDKWAPPGRPRRNVEERTYEFHYRVEVFYTVVDVHLEELRHRFSETNTELLICVACLSPCDRFIAFDQFKLVKLAKFYPYDFSELEIMTLELELANYILDVSSHEAFQELNGLNDLCRAMVETKKDIIYPLVFRLLKLALILPVSTATVERAFSAMNIVKTRLRNRMCDQFLNDCLVCYIEKDVFDSISNDSIMHRFQNMKTRRGQM